jgi:hypothetical protein
MMGSFSALTLQRSYCWYYAMICGILSSKKNKKIPRISHKDTKEEKITKKD